MTNQDPSFQPERGLINDDPSKMSRQQFLKVTMLALGGLLVRGVEPDEARAQELVADGSVAVAQKSVELSQMVLANLERFEKSANSRVGSGLRAIRALAANAALAADSGQAAVGELDRILGAKTTDPLGPRCLSLVAGSDWSWAQAPSDVSAKVGAILQAEAVLIEAQTKNKIGEAVDEFRSFAQVGPAILARAGDSLARLENTGRARLEQIQKVLQTDYRVVTDNAQMLEQQVGKYSLLLSSAAKEYGSLADISGLVGEAKDRAEAEVRERADELAAVCFAGIKRGIDQNTGRLGAIVTRIGSAATVAEADIREFFKEREFSERKIEAALAFGQHVFDAAFPGNSSAKKVFSDAVRGYHDVKTAVATADVAFKAGQAVVGLFTGGSLIGALGGVNNIAGLFGGGAGAGNAELKRSLSEIKQSIAELQAELREFRQQVNHRLDVLEDLGRQSVARLDLALDLLDKIGRGQEEIKDDLKKLEETLTLDLNTGLDASRTNAFKPAFLSWQALADSAIQGESFGSRGVLAKSALTEAKNYSWTESTGPVFTSVSSKGNDVTALSILLARANSAQEAEYTRYVAAQQVTAFLGLINPKLKAKTIPNPVEWSRGANLFLNAAAMAYGPDGKLPSSVSSYLQQIIDRGLAIQDGVNSTLTSSNFAALRTSYEKQMKTVGTALEDFVDAFSKTRNFWHPDYHFELRPLPSTEKGKVLAGTALLGEEPKLVDYSGAWSAEIPSYDDYESDQLRVGHALSYGGRTPQPTRSARDGRHGGETVDPITLGTLLHVFKNVSISNGVQKGLQVSDIPGLSFAGVALNGPLDLQWERNPSNPSANGAKGFLLHSWRQTPFSLAKANDGKAEFCTLNGERVDLNSIDDFVHAAEFTLRQFAEQRVRDMAEMIGREASRLPSCTEPGVDQSDYNNFVAKHQELRKKLAEARFEAAKLGLFTAYLGWVNQSNTLREPDISEANSVLEEPVSPPVRARLANPEDLSTIVVSILNSERESGKFHEIKPLVMSAFKQATDGYLGSIEGMVKEREGSARIPLVDHTLRKLRAFALTNGLNVSNI